MIVDTHIVDVHQETPIDRTFQLAIPAEAREAFEFTPGQFVVVHDPREVKPRRRAYSISSPPSTAPHLELTVRDMGSFGHTFYSLVAGTALAMRTPAGRFVLQEAPGERVLMVAGGSGVTPFRSFVGAMHARGATTSATLLQTAQQPEELVFRETFHTWAREHAPFDYVPTVTRAAPESPWSGRRGRIDAALVHAHLEAPEQTRFYVCGPAPFVQAMLALAEEAGVPADRRHREQWG